MKKLLQVGAVPQWTLSTRMLGLKMRTKPRTTSRSCVAKSTIARKTFSPVASRTPTTLIADEEDDHDRADDDVPRVLPQRPPEDREVVRDEERRDGDRDDVVQHLRPGGSEADELVEGVAREAGGAAGLRIADRALGVRERGRGEDHAGDHEDDRRQPEREDGGDAERVVDRRADVPVRGGEQRRRPEDAVEPLLRLLARAARLRSCSALSRRARLVRALRRTVSRRGLARVSPRRSDRPRRDSAQAC